MRLIAPIHLFLLVLIACSPGTTSNSEQEENSEQSEEINEIEPRSDSAEYAAPIPTEFTHEDSTYLNEQISRLSGIEQFAVRDNYFLYVSLLEKQGDSTKASKIKNLIEKSVEYPYYFTITTLDPGNGYIAYYIQEESVTQCYWNLTDGGRLIGTERLGCGPVCESYISFEKYYMGEYTLLALEDVIPGYERLNEMLVPDIEEQMDPFEFRYILPQRGRDMKFCLEEDCILLKWNDGSFIIQET
jgi:hypothetical protein